MDTGDLLYSRDSVETPNARQIGNLKAELYMKAYNLMGYDAFTPGELDLSFGVGDLIKMSQQANFPLLAANLIHTGSMQPVFKPYVIKEVGGIKIGIFGLVSGQSSPWGPPEEKDKFKITDPFEAAKNAVGVLKRECRLIVALAHMEADEQKLLVERVPGIHFVINGHLSHAHSTPLLVGQSQILIAGARGEYLGQVDLFQQKMKIYSRYQLNALKADCAEKPEVQAWVAQYKDRLQSVQQPLTMAGGPPMGPSGSASILAVPQLLAFMGEKSCQTCHPREHEHWATTAHARAYWTLVERNKASDPSCLPCHTTGYGSFQDPRARFENVQCEACHGPGEAHPNVRKGMERAEEYECRKCHTATNSPSFNFDIYVRGIIHPR
ncbi:MAG TPA: multiheme c-type cytochrome [Thermodesulfobacteriota bacterium]|nr:multiheme c-type cytochrome [Thermodesulfobacteriota bacterium]